MLKTKAAVNARLTASLPAKLPAQWETSSVNNLNNYEFAKKQ